MLSKGYTTDRGLLAQTAVQNCRPWPSRNLALNMIMSLHSNAGHFQAKFTDVQLSVYMTSNPDLSSSQKMDPFEGRLLNLRHPVSRSSGGV